MPPRDGYKSNNRNNNQLPTNDNDFELLPNSNNWKISSSTSAGFKKDMNKNDSYKKKAPYSSVKPLKTVITPLPVDGYLLNNLKTGNNITGIVASCTPYAAYVDLNVYRKGKGGSFTKVNGMLHFSDFQDKVLLATDRKANAASTLRNNIQILTKGSEVTVYVKEVLKQAG